VSQLNLSQALFSLLFEAVEAALKPLRAGQPLVPFALVRTKRGVEMRRSTDETMSAALERARRMLAAADSDLQAYVLAYDATITVDGREYDAVLLECGERGKDQGWRFAQRYQPGREAQPLFPIGEVAYLGIAETYFQES